ncbi:hypothetical protein Ccr5_gp230 [Caulobacter phage Ccr5]|nr:hypothetical protein Ccr5_gp230 [Caulobacter phage Ccr5]
MTNHVWIELEPSASEGHARAAAASAMLKRLGVDVGVHKPVFWHERNERYCFTLDASGVYVEAEDHGHWYNLDFLAGADV